jgi:hypothetical protein
MLPLEDLLLTASPLDLVLDHGLVHERQLMEPSFSVRAVGGRNRSALVTTSSAAFLVKVLGSADWAQREADALEWGRGTTGAFRIPRVRVLDDDLLITETPPGLRPIADVVVKQRFPRTLLRRVGADLAVLHGQPPPVGARSAEFLPLALPGAPVMVLDESHGVRAVLTEVYSDRPLMDALRAVADRAAGHRQAVHGDIRSANLLVRAGTPSGAELYLIDWETAGTADPMVDVGAAMAQVLSVSMRASTTGPDRAGLRILLDAYREHGGDLDLARAVQRAGVSLIRYASEASASTDRLTSLARTCLRIARIAILTPESLAVQLRLVT